MFPYQVSQKIIISGKFLEHYTYEKPYWVGWPQDRSFIRKTGRFKPYKDQESIREDNVRRTRIKIRRLVNSNQDLNKFMTLTFNSSITDLSSANPYFRLFIKRLVRIYPKFKYLCVPEFQPNSGRVHYHLLCNIPFINKLDLEKIWGNGYVFIRKIDSIDNLGAYICKYLGKANFDTRYFKKNKFFYSQNLIKPLIIDKIDTIKSILLNIPKTCSQVFSSFFDTKYLGRIDYLQYKMNPFDYFCVLSSFSL